MDRKCRIAILSLLWFLENEKHKRTCNGSSSSNSSKCLFAISSPKTLHSCCFILLLLILLLFGCCCIRFYFFSTIIVGYPCPAAPTRAVVVFRRIFIFTPVFHAPELGRKRFSRHVRAYDTSSVPTYLPISIIHLHKISDTLTYKYNIPLWRYKI